MLLTHGGLFYMICEPLSKPIKIDKPSQNIFVWENALKLSFSAIAGKVEMGQAIVPFFMRWWTPCIIIPHKVLNWHVWGNEISVAAVLVAMGNNGDQLYQEIAWLLCRTCSNGWRVLGLIPI